MSSSKQIVRHLLEKRPDDVWLPEIVRKIEFVFGARKGLEEIGRGERILIEQIERELPSWVLPTWGER